ncbi:MAG: ORF6N domain-containing protein [bacterium]
MSSCITGNENLPGASSVNRFSLGLAICEVWISRFFTVWKRALNQAVTRNRDRFPADFMFQLSADEYDCIRAQFVAEAGAKGRNSSQIVMSSRWGCLRFCRDNG